jgi:hypothetical protein
MPMLGGIFQNPSLNKLRNSGSQLRDVPTLVAVRWKRQIEPGHVDPGSLDGAGDRCGDTLHYHYDRRRLELPQLSRERILTSPMAFPTLLLWQLIHRFRAQVDKKAAKSLEALEKGGNIRRRAIVSVERLTSILGKPRVSTIEEPAGSGARLANEENSYSTRTIPRTHRLVGFAAHLYTR